MGIFSKAKNFVTGGGAEVSLQTSEFSPEKPLKVRVTAKATDDDMDINRAYVIFRGYEEVEVYDHDYDDDFGGNTEHEYVTTFEKEKNLCGSKKLPQGEEHQWETKLSVPSNAPNPYDGHNASHEYQIMAGLDVTGNDPDSGWITIAPDH